jgi:hypothetical protein
MIIANRTLMLKTDSGDIPVEVRIHEPVFNEPDWSCEYEIDWPEGKRVFKAYGFDSAQALHLAFVAIGCDLYISEHHEQGRLRWGQLGAGYGFPVTSNIRDALVGDDRQFFS